jgi:Cation transporter/ATPase, N-terminus
MLHETTAHLVCTPPTHHDAHGVGTPFWKLVLKQFDDYLVKVLIAAAVVDLIIALVNGERGAGCARPCCYWSISNDMPGMRMPCRRTTCHWAFVPCSAFVEPGIIVLILLANGEPGIVVFYTLANGGFWSQHTYHEHLHVRQRHTRQHIPHGPEQQHVSCRHAAAVGVITESNAEKAIEELKAYEASG